jgi:hypothetical protein
MLRWALLASAIVLGLALAAGTVRILPWLLAPSVPLGVTVPFARALCSVAIESAFVLGVPIGFAFAAALLVRRGEARALFALGVPPFGVARASLPILIALGVVAMLAQRVVDPRPDAPGRIAVELIAQGRASCQDARAPRSVLVPMVGVSWLCFPDAPPRVAGRVPGGLRSAWFTAKDLRPSDTLTEFTLWDARLAFRRTASLPETHVAVDRATVRGLPPWGHGARLNASVRALVIAVSVWAVALVACWLALRFSVASPAGGLVVGGSGALATLTVLHALDKAGPSFASYLWLPAAGVMATALAAASVPRITALLRRLWPVSPA